MRRLFFLLCLLLSAPAWATTYYVDNSGCGDCATYTPATRLCGSGSATVRDTVAEGIALLASGDTLYIRTGTFAETIRADDDTNVLPGGSDSAHRTTISAYGSETVTLTGDVGDYFIIYIEPDDADGSQIVRDHILIQNLVCDWANKTDHPASIMDFRGHPTGPIVLDDINVVGCTVKRNTGATHGSTGDANGIHSDGNTSNFNITNNTVQDIGCGPGDNGIYLGGTGHTVSGNSVSNIADTGVQMYASSGTNTSSTVKNSTISDVGNTCASETNCGRGILLSGTNHTVYNCLIFNPSWQGPEDLNNAGIYLYAGSGHKVYNCTIYQMKNSGIYLYNSDNAEIKNCIIRLPWLDCIYIDAATSGTVLLCNQLYEYDPGMGIIARNERAK